MTGPRFDNWAEEEDSAGQENRPNRVLAILGLSVICLFFGEGFLLVLNLFVPFLSEEAFAFLGLGAGLFIVVVYIASSAWSGVEKLRRFHDRSRQAEDE